MAKGTKKKKKELTIEEKLEQALVPEEEWPYEVPENWCWVIIGSITTVVGGGTPSSKVQEYYEDGEIPWITPADLSGYESLYISHGNRNITQLGLEKSSAKLLPKGTVCLSSRAPIGYTVIAENEISTNQGFKSFVPSPVYLPEYLLWYLKGNKKLLESRASGTTFLELSAKKAALIEFPLAPLGEQQRIVNRIESLFAKLDEAREKAQAVVDGFEDRKAVILHKAFTGELTAEWRNSKGICMGSWREYELITILKDKPRNGYSPKPVNYETPYKSMTLSATTSGVFLPEHYKYIDEEISEDSYLWLKPGDILMQRANSLEKVGTSALYTGKEHEFIYPDLIMKLQVNEQAISEYVAYYLKTGKVLQFLRKNATGTAGNMPKINQKTVSQIPIVLPIIEEQSEIVHRLDTLLALEKSANDAVVRFIDKIDTIRKIILSRAFRGELGTNNLTDESAEELLRKIL